MSVNLVILVGHVGKGPEPFTAGGVSGTRFPMATSEVYKDKEGNKVTNTEWHQVTVWRGLATEVVDKFVKKGTQIYLEGKIKTTSYEKDGTTRYSTGIIANQIRLLSSPKEESRNNEPPTPPAANFDTPDDMPF